MKHRIQKLLALANLGSRRAAEEYITAGRVRVNGQVAELGAKADPETDVITVDGERLNLKTPLRYIMYYKPMNVLSTTERQAGDDRPTVREMVPVEGHFFTIGRLDVESEGMVVLTNDGDLANRLAHPRYEHTKTYKVTVYGEVSQQTLDTWERGIMLPDEEQMTAPCSIRVQEQGGGETTLRIVMTEGRNRQIRRVAAALGHGVKRLVRTHIGQLGIGTLRKGEWVELTGEDLKLLTTPHSESTYIDKLKRGNMARERRNNL
nr:rRNA pseudouridine synthase [Anaerolineae bacterium]